MPDYWVVFRTNERMDVSASPVMSDPTDSLVGIESDENACHVTELRAEQWSRAFSFNYDLRKRALPVEHMQIQRRETPLDYEWDCFRLDEPGFAECLLDEVVQLFSGNVFIHRHLVPSWHLRDSQKNCRVPGVLPCLDSFTVLTQLDAMMKAQGKKRILLTDDQRRLLAVKGKSLGRKALMELTTIVTPDTISRPDSI